MSEGKTSRQILEEALLAQFDDLATHSAYADLLMEEGDPRGEFIQLQIALDNSNRPHRELETMRVRASEIRFAHEREWLGQLATHLMPPRRSGRVDPVEPNCTYGWMRGWLGRLSIFSLNARLVEAFATAPELRMLQELSIAQTRDVQRPAPDLTAWIESPYFHRLRMFRLGDPEQANCTAEGSQAVALVTKSASTLERLELLAEHTDTASLFTLAMRNLRELRVDYADRYPLDLLAMNSGLRKVERIAFDPRPEYRTPVEGQEMELATTSLEEIRAFCHAPQWEKLNYLRIRLTGSGDMFCEELVRSGLLQRLKNLDLCQTGMTDEGARILAECHNTANLKQLDVQGNQLSVTAVEQLMDLDIKVHAAYQMGNLMPPDGNAGIGFGGGGIDVQIEDI